MRISSQQPTLRSVIRRSSLEDLIVPYNRGMRSPRPPSKKQPLSARPAVLSPAARAYAKKIEGNRQRAIEFLKKAGIIDKPGTLARPYR